MARVELVPWSGCWIWLGAVQGRDQHGQIRIDNKVVYAHRAAYEAFVGAIPDGLNVCHRCDVPFCINPAHLFVGTPSDNMRDMVAKGRGRAPRLLGSEHHNAKLSESGVRKLLALRVDGWSFARLSREFHINPATAKDVLAGRTWSHVTGIPCPHPK